MQRTALTTVVAVVAAFSVGLTWSWFTNRAPQGVAVVDLDEVARQLGRDAEMLQSFQSQADLLSNALKQVQEKTVAQLTEYKKGLGEDISVEEARSFQKLQQAANIKFNQLRGEADRHLSAHRQQLVKKFREDAQPLARRIAQEKGFATVVTKNDSFLFSFDETVDITKDVVDLMRSEMPPVPATTPAPAKSEIQQASAEIPAQETAAQPADSTTR